MAKYSPYKMKGHTLPGIKQRQSPAKDIKSWTAEEMKGTAWMDKDAHNKAHRAEEAKNKEKKSPSKWAQFIPMAISAVQSMKKKKEEE